jgi:hypothetical protein
MSMFDALSIAACAASLVLLFDPAARGPGAAAVVAAGLQALILFHVVQIRASGFPVPLVLAGAVVLAAALAWVRATAKPAVTAATAATLAAALQVLRGLKLF